MYVCSNEWETLAKTLASLPCSSMPVRAHCLARAPLRGDSVLILVVGLVYWILVWLMCWMARGQTHTLVLTRIQVAATGDPDGIVRRWKA